MDVELQRRMLGCELIADVAHSFGVVRLQVTGASMIPTIWPGDILTVRSCSIDELQLGQIVLCKQERRLIAHRVTRICGNLLITRGDTLRDNDPPIKTSDIVGQVVSLVRNGRSVNLHQTSWQRLSSSLLRQSDFCLRMTLHLGHRLRSFRTGDRS